MTLSTLHPDWMDWPHTQQLMAAFAKNGASMRFVGGAVRDALLGISVQDVDIATPLVPEAVIALLDKTGIRVFPTGIVHGTVTAVIEGKHFEITTLRKDIACDGRHADVTFTDNWQEDASRRDFTINALYLSPQGELFDYFGGIDDAKVGYLRFIGEPSQRIEEDYLRILRFFRFYARYGKLPPDEAALAACAQLASGLNRISGERIREEMLALLSYSAYPALCLMHERRILPYVLDFTVHDVGIFEQLAKIENIAELVIEPYIKLACFILKSDAPMDETLDRLMTRWRLSNQQVESLRVVLSSKQHIRTQLSEAEQKRLLRRLGQERFIWAVALKWADIKEQVSTRHPYYAMLSLARSWEPPLFPITGDDLIALGMEQGKALGAMLARLEEEWEASDYTLDKPTLLKRINS